MSPRAVVPRVFGEVIGRFTDRSTSWFLALMVVDELGHNDLVAGEIRVKELAGTVPLPPELHRMGRLASLMGHNYYL